MGFRYTKLTNLFKSVRKQNSPQILFGFVYSGPKSWLGQLNSGGIIEFHYFASEEVTIVLATDCTSKTVFKLD